MNSEEIAKEIINSNLNNEDINTIIDAIKTAQKMNRERLSAIAMTTLKPGMRGVLTGLSPKSLNGTEVEVVSTKRSRVTIQEVNNPGYNGRYTVPAHCIIPTQ